MPELHGKVESVSSEGDLVTDIQVASLGNAPRDESLTIYCDGHATQGLFPPDHGQREMTFLAIRNANGFVQISIVGGSAHQFLNIKPGTEVKIRW